MSSTIVARIPCTLTPHIGFDDNGQPSFAAARNEQVAVVRLRKEVTHTTVRADASASRGYADDYAASTKILFRPETIAKMGDKILISGVTLRIVSMHPRYSVWGNLDHFEVTGEAWD